MDAVKPLMPGDNFELQMWLEDLTAELDEVWRCRLTLSNPR